MVTRTLCHYSDEKSLVIKISKSSYDEAMDNRYSHRSPSPLIQQTSPGKPKARAWGQHALWVGNITPGATVMNLRDYFSEPTPNNVLSVAYNPDAKYAFVNFTSELSRAAAITHAATNMFEGRRLDCRIRQGSMSRSTKVHYGTNNPGHPSFTVSSEEGTKIEQQVQELLHFPETMQSEWGQDKYFILKSFSLEALSRSIETGQWYIPKRHCTRLNVAFKSARNVFFIFSVNGSGSFSGVALMKSETRKEPVVTSHRNDIHRTNSCRSEGSLPSFLVSSASQDEAGMRVPTPGSAISAPGTICYEPERRRIVWEALQDPLDNQMSEEEDMPSTPSTSSSQTTVLSPWGSTFESFVLPSRDRSNTLPSRHDTRFQSPSVRAIWESETSEISSQPALLSKLEQFGNPCQIEWLSTQNVPFDDVRGIKNAWNSNKEVHVARNITAVEPSAADALLNLWRIRPEIG